MESFSMGGETAMYNFREYNRDQAYLLPPSLKDWLPEDHLAWFIVDAVVQMDLGPFYARYRSDGWGGKGYDPEMMVALLLYSYCIGVRSSRVIERHCQEDIAFRVVSANQMPDHATIARFRQHYEEELADLFTEVLRLCYEAGLVRVGKVYLDGTKVKANAALAANRSYDHIRTEVERMLQEAAAVDRDEDEEHGPGERGDELPPELRRRADRLQRLRSCKERLEQEAQARAAEQQAKIAAKRAQEQATGKRSRGRPPKDPDASVTEEAKANTTDPDSRVMKTRQGYIQGYNAQAMVTEDQVIVAADITQECNDVQQLHPVLAQAAANLEETQIPERIGATAADAGYWSEDNVTKAPPDGPELFIATQKDRKQREAMRSAPPPRGRIARDASPNQRMERKLLTKRGREIYGKRSPTVEPVFGQIKDGRGADGFLRRGAQACRSEWRLVCLTHNLLKLWRHVQGTLTATQSMAHRAEAATT